MEQKSWGGRILPTVRGKSSNDVANVVALLCWSVAKSCPTLCDPMDCSTPVLPCLSLSPRVFSNSCPFSQWCYLTISSSATFFSFYLQSFPASGYFPVSQLFASGGQSIGASALVSVLSMNIQGRFPLALTGFDLLAVQGTLKSLLQRSSKASVLQHSAFFMVQLSHLYMTTGKTIALTLWTFVSKVISLLFNTLSRFVMAFLPRSKCPLFHGCSHHLQWFWSPWKNLSLLAFFPHLFAMKWWNQMPWFLLFECWVLSQLFHCPLSPHQEVFSSSSLSAIRVVSSAY